MSKRNANGKKQKLDRGESLATMKKVLHYLAAYRVLFVLSLLLAAVVVVLTLYLPILTGRAIDLLVGQGEVDPDGRLPGILLTAGIVILVTAVCQWLMNIVNNHITFGVVRRLRQDAFVHLQRLPLSYLDRRPVPLIHAVETRPAGVRACETVFLRSTAARTAEHEGSPASEPIPTD